MTFLKALFARDFRSQAFKLLVAAIALVGCTPGEEGGGTGSPSAPNIASFSATSSPITAGNSTTLRWTTTNATSLSIDNGVGAVTGAEVSVTPASTTTYTLTATNAVGSVTATTTVTVSPVTQPAPTITAFIATPTTIMAGGSSTLSWTVSNATSLSINNGVGTVTGASRIVSPTTTTTYTLTATNASGSNSASVTVTVNAIAPLPTISSFSASPATITAGASTTLNWSASNATLLSIDKGVGAVTGTSRSVSPATTTTYTLTATNATGSTTASTMVTVNSVAQTTRAPIGINADFLNDYSGDVIFADAMKTSRQWSTTNLDSNGWPKQDANIMVWAGVTFSTSGTYALSFEGQADVSGVTLANKSWNASTNVTTGTFSTSSSTLTLTFSNTKRTASSGANTGVANVKLMRPIALGATTSYRTDATFTAQAKALFAKFSTIRFLDFTYTNANPQVNWIDRTRPDWATQFRWSGAIWSSSPMGGAWEYAIQLCNETGTDLWINVPIGASDDYVTKLAQLVAYGSNGDLPYTTTQTNPKYAPLNSNLKVYVEFSNEIWNTAAPFTQSTANKNAAVAEASAGGSPLNFDGGAGEWDWAARRSAKRTVEISNIFRTVFGDGAMMTRVRPVLESQQGYTGWWAYQQSRMMEDYYTNATRVSSPKPPSYYVYGGGGSAYYAPGNSNTSLTLDSIWSGETFNTANWASVNAIESTYALSLYGNRVAYEGGPSMDKCSCAADAVKEQAWSDSRMAALVTDHQTNWDRYGGRLLMYFHSTGDYQWGFASDVYDTSAPKVAAVNAINATTRATGNAGATIPGTLAASSFKAPESFGVNASALSASGQNGSTWLGYLVHNATSGNFNFVLSAGSSGTSNQADLYVDGAFIGTFTIGNTGGNSSFAPTSALSTNLSVGTHAIKIKAKSGSFGLNTIDVTN